MPEIILPKWFKEIQAIQKQIDDKRDCIRRRKYCQPGRINKLTMVEGKTSK